MNRLWWLGLYESVQPPILPWLFSYDYARDILVGGLKFLYGGQYYSILYIQVAQVTDINPCSPDRLHHLLRMVDLFLYLFLENRSNFKLF